MSLSARRARDTTQPGLGFIEPADPSPESAQYEEEKDTSSASGFQIDDHHHSGLDDSLNQLFGPLNVGDYSTNCSSLPSKDSKGRVRDRSAYMKNYHQHINKMILDLKKELNAKDKKIRTLIDNFKILEATSQELA